MTMTKTIGQLIADHAGTRAALDAKLLQMFPPGSTVGFTITSTQANPSTGVVLSVALDAGYMRVRHNEAKPRGRYEVRTVHHSRILWCEGKGQES